MEALPSQSWFVTTAYAAAALCIAWMLLRTTMRHMLAKRALRALEDQQHETQA